MSPIHVRSGSNNGRPAWLLIAAVLVVLAADPLDLTRAEGTGGLSLRGHLSDSEPSITRKFEVQPDTRHKRPVAVSDGIGMTRIAGRRAMLNLGGGLSENFATFSPDGNRFVMVTKRGNLEQNTNEYSLLLYESGSVFGHPQPKRLVTFASSSNREGINDVSWLDNDTVLFLGERPAETTQLYSVNCNSMRIRKLTKHRTNLLEYSVAHDGKHIAYVAEVPVTALPDQDALHNGLHISTELLSDVLAGHSGAHQSELFAMRRIGEAGKRLEAPNRLQGAPIALSPNGKYLVVEENVTEIPPGWKEYEDPQGYLGRVFRLHIPRGAPTWIRRYNLIDVETGTSRVLLDAPVKHWTGSEALWLPDSRSVILTGVYLPLNVSEPVERTARERSAFVAEVKIPSLDTIKITDRNLETIKWYPQTRVLQLGTRESVSTPPECYEQEQTGWELVSSGCPAPSEPEILAEQDLNTPPQVVAVNPRTGRKATLLDLNPEFKSLAFGKVEIIKWTAGDGKELLGGLYLPPDYVAGQRYPLVIQTHGFDSRQFWIDGPFSTANAAQALAAKRIVVLQVPDSHDLSVSGTPDEAPRMMDIYEKAIEFLDARGIIDLSRVGLIGFSHTCWFVKYALTHSKYHFAAAVVADGIDGGYFQYMTFANQSQLTESFMENVIGAHPFGEGLSLWLKRSPGFLLDKVQAPILIQAIGGSSLLGEWEWFAGLSRLNKPVDLVYIPEGTHVVQKPWERMVSQQGDVDWFCFWLKGEEDSAPGKAGEYIRWNRLRALSSKN